MNEFDFRKIGPRKDNYLSDHPTHAELVALLAEKAEELNALKGEPIDKPSSSTTPNREQVVQWIGQTNIDLNALALSEDDSHEIGHVISLARADLEATIAEQAEALNKGKFGRELELEKYVEVLTSKVTEQAAEIDRIDKSAGKKVIELVTVADELRYQLAAQQATEKQLREALRELVACKNLKSQIEAIRFAGPNSSHGADWEPAASALESNYNLRKPDAWIAACEALLLPSDESAPPPGPSI